jgi:hypothetical protein
MRMKLTAGTACLFRRTPGGLSRNPGRGRCLCLSDGRSVGSRGECGQGSEGSDDAAGILLGLMPFSSEFVAAAGSELSRAEEQRVERVGATASHAECSCK